MIVCVCNNVSDRKIRQAVENGVCSMNQLRKELDVGTCCGKCYSHALQIVRATQVEQREAQPMFFHGALAAM